MATNQKPPLEEYGEWWDWESDGDCADGTFVRAGRGYTAMGERAFVVLTIDNQDRTLWLHQEVLQSSFAREVKLRADHELHVGERITVWKIGERESASGRTYIDFRVKFGDAAVPTQLDIFGGPDDEPSVEPAEADDDDDDIPI
jgi:hypothetical protein